MGDDAENLVVTEQPQPPDRPLSHLELTVLGLVRNGSPCTPYWIRQQFKSSLSSHFSGSAGAVYPAIRRLEKRGLVAAVAKRRGTRESRVYRLTASGVSTLRDWLLPPLRKHDVAFVVDPVRVCVFFFEVLEPEERVRFLDEALLESNQFAAQVAEDCATHEKAGKLWDYAGARGTLHQIQARIRWLEEVRDLLGAHPPDRPGESSSR